jgi:DNA-binding transcriptional ArsR family regulator
MSADVFRAIADPTRRKLIELLAAGERPVGELAAEFQMSQPAVSQHLRVLREAGLVDEERRGRFRQYRLTPAPLEEVDGWLHHYRRFWRGRLAALEQLLDEENAPWPKRSAPTTSPSTRRRRSGRR